MTPPDPVALALILARILEQLGVRYCVGGSVASSVYGEVRTTLDVDLVADLGPEHVDALVAAVESDFHVVDEAIRRAVSDRSSFNLIHEETLVKADVYVPPDDPTHLEQLARSRRVALRSEPGSEVELASPEDVVIHKLRWYEMDPGTRYIGRISNLARRLDQHNAGENRSTVRAHNMGRELRQHWVFPSCWPAPGRRRSGSLFIDGLIGAGIHGAALGAVGGAGDTRKGAEIGAGVGAAAHLMRPRRAAYRY